MKHRMKAYITELQGTQCIVAAENAGKAKYATYRSALAAGWEVAITEVYCRREKQYDKWANLPSTLPRNCYMPGLANHIIEAKDE